MRSYARDHQDPVNQACHVVGIPLIAASSVCVLLGKLQAGAALGTAGWALQFVGHYIEGEKPVFVDDKRALLVGLMWWSKKVGLGLVSVPE